MMLQNNFIYCLLVRRYCSPAELAGSQTGSTPGLRITQRRAATATYDTVCSLINSQEDLSLSDAANDDCTNRDDCTPERGKEPAGKRPKPSLATETKLLPNAASVGIIRTHRTHVRHSIRNDRGCCGVDPTTCIHCQHIRVKKWLDRGRVVAILHCAYVRSIVLLIKSKSSAPIRAACRSSVE